MTNEEKQLLLKDLCARLPYGVKYKTYLGDIFTLKDITFSKTTTKYYIDDNAFSVDQIKPYLRPMSSMTKEEKEYLQTLHNIISDENYGDGFSPTAWNAISLFNDYCHKRHLDNAGLIEKDLTLPAAENMYK